MDNFHEETVEHFRGVEVMDDDVMLVTFPKCGTSEPHQHHMPAVSIQPPARIFIQSTHPHYFTPNVRTPN